MRRASQQIRQLIGPFRDSGNLLGEVLQLRSLGEGRTENGEMFDSMVTQIAGSAESFLGNHREALQLFDQQDPGTEAGGADGSQLAALRSEEAVVALLRAARSSRAVLINEAHHVAQHRVLTRRLLPLLREAGFTHFAAETLFDGDSGLLERGYPTAATGHYTQEPLYGDLVRQAIALGYQIVAYESPGPPAEREPAQARNLAERIFSDPKARALIHLGYSHNLESADSFNGVGAMAWHLQNLTGIDPLTVDQTRMRERSSPTQEDPLYPYAADTLGIEKPVVFITKDGQLWHPADDPRDVTVFLPRTRYEHGRPHWLHLGGLRHPLGLPEDICRAATPCVVEARPAHEGDDAIPVDRVEVTPRRQLPVLFIPEGQMRIQALDAEQNVLRSWTHPPG